MRRSKGKYLARGRINHHSDIHFWMRYQHFSFSLIHFLDILFTLQMEIQPFFLVARCVWNDPQKCGKNPQDMRGEALQRVVYKKEFYVYPKLVGKRILTKPILR